VALITNPEEVTKLALQERMNALPLDLFANWARTQARYLKKQKSIKRELMLRYLAIATCQGGHPGRAFIALGQAVEEGFRDLLWLEAQALTTLAPLTTHRRFKDIVERVRLNLHRAYPHISTLTKAQVSALYEVFNESDNDTNEVLITSEFSALVEIHFPNRYDQRELEIMMDHMDGTGNVNLYQVGLVVAVVVVVVVVYAYG
jgi:hypothetical protein